ncbi:probable E3 ubiquitin-protein ligase HERC4 isoform X2 [Colossoma macropomum]|uniref:probable E3 ubiquitin-protein ligase HERC4 isoform X2 n=1 Tax=Colossoma macropomum TaxID=42526 RepID=UPI0018648C55|nr:probable E3 ubiquitin-protein ligase HERC4 isoform X2 [Colossoma macropomum]
MFYWGELTSLDCAGVGLSCGDGFKHILGSQRLSELSVKRSLLAFLTADGKVTVVLLNGQSEEGQNKTQTSRGGKAPSPYKRFNITLKEQIHSLSSGKHHVVLVTQAGMVWEWSEQSTITRPFKSLTNKKIAQVACGDDHSVVLTRDGQLFTWGQNSSGQLGLGKDKPSSLSPQPLKSLGGIPLAQISAGGGHSFALSLSGSVFGWGRNSAGQLGLGDREDRYVPVCVKSLNQKKTVFISCGEDHTAVLTKGGLLFTFGLGCYGQLGHNSLRDEHRPRLLGGLWGSKVSQIACGRHHTLALVGSSKTIYSFGCGEQGQLGNGQQTNQCVPLPVCLPAECSPNQTVEKIMAGGNLSVACFQDGEISAGSCKEMSVLDDGIIDRWILDCEKAKAWNKVKRHSGLDLSLARLAFEKLAQKQKILLEVESVVKQNLLWSLGSTAAGVEALRVYLILPELLRVLIKQQRGRQLAVELASAILHLDQESLSVLRSLWTTLPYYYYRTLVKVFHSVSAHFITQMTTRICNRWDEASFPLKVLHELYDINSRRATRLMDDYFYVKELSEFFCSIPYFFSDQQKCLVFQNFMKNVDSLCCYPFIVDMRSKCILFRFLLERQKNVDPPLACENSLCVRREMVLADTLTHLRTNPPDFSLPLKVKFLLEDGFDAGGLRTEFFRLLSQDIRKASGVIRASEDSGLFWFSADTSGTSDEFYYLGVICGMALYNHCHLNIGFPLALFKKLLCLSPTLSDLEELSPAEARSLRNVLMEDEEVEEILCLDFTIQGKELIPNGREIPVTKVNRQKYVDLYVDFFLNKSVEYQFKEFARGFSCGNCSDFWRIFLPEELRLQLYGTSQYEWEELRRIATYEHCGPLDELVQNFWTVFCELSEEHKKKFLIFMYATDRLPVGGLSQLRLILVRCDYENADERFPVAQTCFGTLHLPNYSNIQILRDRLIHAITCCEVFGKA